MTDRDHAAIRDLVNLLREDRATKHRVLSRMKDFGYSEAETVSAIRKVTENVRDDQ